ncbi:MAG: DUF3667 domain-containing protein [Bacteroidales bacterium]|nr:DUF3667 domain-containing protein [Bacteroidales bacterium]
MKCLNCENIAEGNFCENCGQKISTRRFSLISIFDYAVLNGIFSVNKGILFTVKKLLTKPGHSIREYIQGKRINYFNAFTLLLLLLTLAYFLEEFTGIKLADITAEGSEEFANLLEEFMKEYPRIIYLINIPLLAISSYLFFRKSKYNFAENIVLDTYIISAQIIMTLPFSILVIFYNNVEFIKIIYNIYSVITLIYAFWVIYQFFSKSGYKKMSLIFRSIFSLILYMILQLITIVSIALVKSHI